MGYCILGSKLFYDLLILLPVKSVLLYVQRMCVHLIIYSVPAAILGMDLWSQGRLVILGSAENSRGRTLLWKQG